MLRSNTYDILIHANILHHIPPTISVTLTLPIVFLQQSHHIPPTLSYTLTLSSYFSNTVINSDILHHIPLSLLHILTPPFILLKQSHRIHLTTSLHSSDPLIIFLRHSRTLWHSPSYCSNTLRHIPPSITFYFSDTLISHGIPQTLSSCSCDILMHSNPLHSVSLILPHTPPMLLQLFLWHFY